MALVRNRLLVATGVALLMALIGGYLVAQALARRVRRLERAAEQVARGRFIDPLPVDSEDELGQLTRTFNEMQEQLRQLDRARKDFIATASHELRTPIFSLGGFVELLQDEDLDARRAASSWRRWASRWSASRSSPSTCSTCRGSTPARSSCTPSGWTSRSWRERVLGEFTPAVGAHGTEPQGGPARRTGWRPTATASGWPRSCVSCSTMPFATLRREPP